MDRIESGAVIQPSSRVGQAGQSAVLPFDALRSSNWTLGPLADRETGNACVGIAVGCLLSLPIWLVVVALFALLG